MQDNIITQQVDIASILETWFKQHMQPPSPISWAIKPINVTHNLTKQGDGLAIYIIIGQYSLQD